MRHLLHVESRNRFARAGWWLLLAAWLTGPARGQEPDPLPDPEVVELLTKDGVQLKATYYGSDRKKDAVPLILLHMFKGSRSDFEGLALFLQEKHHHAVLTLDLRGHGESLRQTMGEEERLLSPDKLRGEDFEKMATHDVEEAKRFLLRENNASKVNIERLGLIGAEMGGTIGAYWCYLDWSAPRLAIKQGQDVKALVLMSPESRFKSISLSQPLIDPEVRNKISMHILAGKEDSKSSRAATTLYNAVKRYHKEPEDSVSADKALAEKTLFLDIEYNTSLKGTKMLGEGLGVEDRIAKFIELRLVKPSHAWADRPSAIP